MLLSSFTAQNRAGPTLMVRHGDVGVCDCQTTDRADSPLVHHCYLDNPDVRHTSAVYQRTVLTCSSGTRELYNLIQQQYQQHCRLLTT